MWLRLGCRDRKNRVRPGAFNWCEIWGRLGSYHESIFIDATLGCMRCDI